MIIFLNDVNCIFVQRIVNVKVKSLSRVLLFVTPWTVAHQAPPSMHGILQARILEWVAISFSVQRISMLKST